MRASKIAAVVAVVLAGCSTYRVSTPPDDLMENCAHAARPGGNTVADLAQAVINERGKLDLCNADKAALRAWATGVKATK